MTTEGKLKPAAPVDLWTWLRRSFLATLPESHRGPAAGRLANRLATELVVAAYCDKDTMLTLEAWLEQVEGRTVHYFAFLAQQEQMRQDVLRNLESHPQDFQDLIQHRQEQGHLVSLILLQAVITADVAVALGMTDAQSTDSRTWQDRAALADQWTSLADDSGTGEQPERASDDLPPPLHLVTTSQTAHGPPAGLAQSRPRLVPAVKGAALLAAA